MSHINFNHIVNAEDYILQTLHDYKGPCRATPKTAVFNFQWLVFSQHY